MCVSEVSYAHDSYKNYRNSIITQLGDIWLFLEDCPTHLQNKYFPDLIEQAIEEYQENKTSDQAATCGKPTKEFNTPETCKIGESYYFIAGSDEIYLLNHRKTEDDKFSSKLSEADLEELEVEIIWTGSKQFKYETDEKKAFTLWCSIIHKMNLQQPEENHSFPVGEHN